MPASYVAEINRSNPGCLLFLLDQSGSMKGPFAGNLAIRKANAAADAINNLLMEIVIHCTQNFGEGPRNFFDVGVIGYGSNSGVGPCFGGALRGRTLVSLRELAENVMRVDERPRLVPDGGGGVVEVVVRFPIWVDPVAEGGAPMHEAVELAGKVLESWVASHAASYPPIVINITDGEADTNPVAAAEKLARIRTTDGTVLLYNIHLSSLAIPPILFPDTPENLPDLAARTLFEMSTTIPRRIAQDLELEGYAVMPGAKGFVFNSDAVMLIRFLDIGTRLTLGDEVSLWSSFETSARPNLRAVRRALAVYSVPRRSHI